MYAGRRITALRVTALAAVLVSAMLTADSVRPGRAFCSLSAACETSRSSALGRILGIPTSVVGMAAFGALFLLTLLRVERSRPLLRPAGFLAALVGAGLFAYQALVLHSFCPFCLVADTAGLLAGILVLTWPAPPVRRSGKRVAPESVVARLRWTAVAAAIVVLPFVWPREEKPSWVPIPDGASVADADASPFESPGTSSADGPEVGANDPVVGRVPARPFDGGDRLPPPPPDPTGLPVVPPMPLDPDPSAVPRPPPGGGFQPPPPAPVPPPRPSPSYVSPPAAPPPRAAPPRADLTIVEYLNAFCAHCRATHARLERVLAAEGLVARRRRVYTWAGDATPMWARAVAFAETQGLEDRMFDELVRAEEESPREVYAAARRAGVDADALAAALAEARVPARLSSDRRAAQSARLEGLPTLDIGRRRLMGEQSEDELREAVLAAVRRAR